MSGRRSFSNRRKYATRIGGKKQDWGEAAVMRPATCSAHRTDARGLRDKTLLNIPQCTFKVQPTLFVARINLQSEARSVTL